MTATRVCALDDIEPGGTHRVEFDGTAVALVRIDDDVYAIGDRCTHQNVSLSEGDVDADEMTLECWKHGSAFSLTTGEPTSLPATKPTPVYEVSVSDGDVYLEARP
ncbi:MAG: non-heme iron oxygenase ferredoxin subunit [Acidimicrobiales bacterium]|nr:non-heme iron oxygenase ferredoxin subunit [Acidimicrobiales bacterium]